MDLNQDLNAALAGAASLKPENIGEIIEGTITNSEVTQHTDYATGKPETWEDGKPKANIVISLRTDDGTDGAIYIKNWGAQRAALRKAIQATGLDANTALAPGNRIAMAYVGNEPNKNPKFDATKLYEFTITPRANLGGAGLDQPGSEPPQQQQPAAAQPAAQQDTGAANDPVATARRLYAASVPIPQIAKAVNLSESAVTAIVTPQETREEPF